MHFSISHRPLAFSYVRRTVSGVTPDFSRGDDVTLHYPSGRRHCITYLLTVLASLNLTRDYMIRRVLSLYNNGISSRSDIVRSARSCVTAGKRPKRRAACGKANLYHSAQSAPLNTDAHLQVLIFVHAQYNKKSL